MHSLNTVLFGNKIYISCHPVISSDRGMYAIFLNNELRHKMNNKKIERTTTKTTINRALNLNFMTL